jgi:hypothetical protein
MCLYYLFVISIKNETKNHQKFDSPNLILLYFTLPYFILYDSLFTYFFFKKKEVKIK